jgi:two-component system OmpR family sensor kinase
MRIGLFYRILLAFWFTLLVVSLGLWLLIAVNRSPEARVVTRAAQPILTLLARTVETAGAAEAEHQVRLLEPRFRDRISIAPLTAKAPPKPDKTRMVRSATAPDGSFYVLAYRYPTQFQPGPLAIPMKVWLVNAAAGLLFSAALAFYLTRPVVVLREGLNRVAQGDLHVRLRDKVGRRSDEIADLARDFDFMTARLQQLIIARDRLLHDVSHELRSPLTRLQLAIGLARQDPRRTEDSLVRIEGEARKLEDLVRQLLALARAEGGAIDDADEYFDLIAVVESVVTDAQFEAQIGGKRVSLELPRLEEDQRLSVRGSAELIRRAIENVVRNALRFSPVGGGVQVTMDIDRAPLRYRCTVLDEGAGVEAGDVDQVFEPFVRGDKAGVGLGLSIARRAVLAHGGEITARNRPSGGFMVEIVLPVLAHDQA